MADQAELKAQYKVLDLEMTALKAKIKSRVGAVQDVAMAKLPALREKVIKAQAAYDAAKAEAEKAFTSDPDADMYLMLKTKRQEIEKQIVW